MSATESARMSREQVKSHRQSSLIQGNVIAFVFRSIDLQSISASSPRTILSSPSLNSESQTEDKLTSKPEQLLQAFKDANKCSLNTKLVESFNELRLVGWYSTYTLMLSAPNEDIRVLKKAWSQRILRNPVGFILKDVGTVKDFVVEWIPPAQFISLTTALHDTVVELDRNGRCASRDAIVKYLKNVYHDVCIPTEDIIHKCLGRLIEQRKIYHDGVGYRALIDNSPIHKGNKHKKKRQETEDISEKCPAKSSVKTKSDNGSVGSAASKDHRSKTLWKFTLSDGSSKEETRSRPYSDEDRTRFNSSFLDHFTNTCSPKMKNKVPKEKKKKSPLVTNSGKLSVYEEGKEDQQVKIIDISDRMSVLRRTTNLDEKSTKEASKQPTSSKNGDVFHSQESSNEKDPSHRRNRDTCEPKATKRSKPQRSRSFTDPSKHRVKNKNLKGTGNDGDFPLRRVMGTEELRSFSKVDLSEDEVGKVDCKVDKTKLGLNYISKIDKVHKNSRKPHSTRPYSATKTPLEDSIINENGVNHNFDEEIENSVTSTISLKSTKLTTDSDTPSGTYASDASSPFQSKKRKDYIEIFSERNNNVENGLTCLCLTGKIIDDQSDFVNQKKIEKNPLKNGGEMTTEHDSIFDYDDDESNAFDYHGEESSQMQNYKLDSIEIGYSL